MTFATEPRHFELSWAEQPLGPNHGVSFSIVERPDSATWLHRLVRRILGFQLGVACWKPVARLTVWSRLMKVRKRRCFQFTVASNSGAGFIAEVKALLGSADRRRTIKSE